MFVLFNSATHAQASRGVISNIWTFFFKIYNIL